MFYKSVLVITDNAFLCKAFIKIYKRLKIAETSISYAFSASNVSFQLDDIGETVSIQPIKVKEQVKNIINNYDLVISLHCKQIFPKALIENIKCINVHPGLNPYNRGWFPQVFSIINKLPLGATIHEIDGEIDHGAIIAQKEVPVYSWDTSLTAYNRVLEAELELIEHNIINILNNNYVAYMPSEEGNINYKKDFERICHIDLNEVNTFRNFIDRIRALTHGDYRNAFFIDEATRDKVFVSLNIKK